MSNASNTKEIDFNKQLFGSTDEVHIYLRDSLGFPGYYGRNLDALMDCLRGINEPCTVIASYAGYDKSTGNSKPLDKQVKTDASYNAHADIMDILGVLEEATLYLNDFKLTVNNEYVTLIK